VLLGAAGLVQEHHEDGDHWSSFEESGGLDSSAENEDGFGGSRSIHSGESEPRFLLSDAGTRL